MGRRSGACGQDEENAEDDRDAALDAREPDVAPVLVHEFGPLAGERLEWQRRFHVAEQRELGGEERRERKRVGELEDAMYCSMESDMVLPRLLHD